MKLVSTQDLVNVTTAWAVVRKNYPGWIIAPDKSREAIWEFTDHWIDVAFSSARNLAPSQALSLLYELNWRLEVSLCPLLVNQAQVISEILLKTEEVTPPAPSTKIGPSGSAESAKQWIQLAFAILREAREDLDTERFDFWSQKLKNRVSNNVEDLSHWYHELCLFNLGTCDHAKVESALKIWTPVHELPFWESKRASIFAELGQIKEAEEIAERALDVIRSRLQPFVVNYTLLSQEGFVMMLLRALQISKIQMAAIDGSHYSARWNQLEAHGCNPWIERRVLELALMAAPPAAIPDVEETEGFDIGDITTTRHYRSGRDFYEHRAGFALLRFFEEGGLPLRCGNVDMGGDSIAQAAAWIQPFAPLWSLTTNIRANKDKAVEKTFDRVRIATLSDKEIDSLYKLLIEAVPEALKQLAINNVTDISFGGRSLPLICELLSRIAFRIRGERLQTLFQLALQMYAVPQRSLATSDCLNHLFYRVLESASKDQLHSWLIILISLPIPDQDGYLVNEFSPNWPEPCDMIDWAKVSPELVDRTLLPAITTKLIRVVEEGGEKARKRSIVRLVGLNTALLLGDEERLHFAKALWCRVDVKTGLPTDVPYHPFAFLTLPSPEPGQAIPFIRKWLLNSSIPPVVRVTTTAGSPPQTSVSGGFSTEYFLTNLVGATEVSWNTKSSAALIDWTPDEAAEFLVKVANWWDQDKQFVLVYDDVRRQFKRIKEVLTIVVLPRLRASDHASFALLDRISQELNENKCPTFVLVPGQVRIDRRPDLAYVELAAALRSGDKETVSDAIEAVLLWCLILNGDDYRQSTAELIHALITKVVALREPCLSRAILTLTRMVDTHGIPIPDSDIDLLAVALDQLLTETALQKAPSIKSLQSERGAIPLNKRPRYRFVSARLAFSIHKRLVESNLSVPTPVKEWQLACRQDPFPEVENAWPPEA